VFNATVNIPKSGEFEATVHTGLSDEQAMIFGRTAAYSLADDEGYASATLSDGTERVFVVDWLSGDVVAQVIG
jgi:hypothetical protein